MSRFNRPLLALLSAALLMAGSSYPVADERANSPAEVSFHGGGWDLNGPAVSGTNVTAKLDLDGLTIESVTPPKN